ncbi:MAG: DUF1698 domain-containing protein [Anaerolineales bacterium]|nr:DUF1698 domain-containing protein [Anaerolineales bacterium]
MSFFRSLFKKTPSPSTEENKENIAPPLPPLIKTPLSSTEEEIIRSRIAEIPYWFHKIEIAPGIFTPGASDAPKKFQRFELPDDLTGKRVLDIGCFEGFFSFECERRGAEVVAVDVVEPGPKSGFSLIHELIGSKSTFHFTSIYDLTPEEIGMFDIVLCLGVIYHLRHPLLGLERARSVCKDLFVVETQICDKYFINAEGNPTDLTKVAPALAQMPMVQFYPGNELNRDSSNWWSPNLAALDGMLRTSGFQPEKYIQNGIRACVHCKAI